MLLYLVMLTVFFLTRLFKLLPLIDESPLIIKEIENDKHCSAIIFSHNQKHNEDNVRGQVMATSHNVSRQRPYILIVKEKSKMQ